MGQADPLLALDDFSLFNFVYTSSYIVLQVSLVFSQYEPIHWSEKP